MSVSEFDGDNLLYQSGIFFSGLESSSNCASFSMMELASNPEYQDLARQDINQAVDKYGWTYEAFTNMKYLDNVIAETLRLHPPLSFLDRYTRDDYQVCPNQDLIFINKNTTQKCPVRGKLIKKAFKKLNKK